jgi:hypothetical protein
MIIYREYDSQKLEENWNSVNWGLLLYDLR